MARAPKSKSIKAIASQSAEDYIWGMPESPEFSSVQRLMNEIQSHAAHEERWLSSYREIAGESPDPLIRFLLDLIVGDEERHHALTKRMISKLRDELASTRSGEAACRATERREMAEQLLRSVESFLEAEHKAIEEYQRLKRESEGLCRDVFALLYATMIHDSHKHIAILEFLRQKLTENGRTQRRRKSC
jgi:rubrerythrin